jgi:hypothetical protein
MKSRSAEIYRHEQQHKRQFCDEFRALSDLRGDHARGALAAKNFQEGLMARKSITERLEQLDAQKRALQARFSKQERARDTRRKVLLGALVLQRLATSHDETQVAWLRMWLRNELPEFLVRPGDKELLADLFATNAPVADRTAALNTAATPERSSSVLEPA